MMAPIVKIFEVEKYDFDQFENRYNEIFADFKKGVFNFVEQIDENERINFANKYRLILESFQEVEQKLIKKIKGKVRNRNILPNIFEQVLEDVDQILNKMLMTIFEGTYDLENYDIDNIFAEDHSLQKTEMKGRTEENKGIYIAFNFLPTAISEARVGFKKIVKDGELSLRFDLDKNINKVFCDFQSSNLDLLLDNDHHILMSALTEFVGEDQNAGEQKKRFKNFVETTKDFLEDIGRAGVSYSLEDLVKKFNQGIQ